MMVTKFEFTLIALSSLSRVESFQAKLSPGAGPEGAETSDDDV